MRFQRVCTKPLGGCYLSPFDANFVVLGRLKTTVGVLGEVIYISGLDADGILFTPRLNSHAHRSGRKAICAR